MPQKSEIVNRVIARQIDSRAIPVIITQNTWTISRTDTKTPSCVRSTKKKKNKIDANNTKEYLKKNKQFLHNSDLNASAHFHYRISTNAINCRVNHWRWLYYTHHRNYLSFFTCYQCQIQWISNSTITHCICVCVSDSLVMAVMPNFNNIQITEWQTI